MQSIKGGLMKINVTFGVVENDLSFNISANQPMRYCEVSIAIRLVGKLKR